MRAYFCGLLAFSWNEGLVCLFLSWAVGPHIGGGEGVYFFFFFFCSRDQLTQGTMFGWHADQELATFI